MTNLMWGPTSCHFSQELQKSIPVAPGVHLTAGWHNQARDVADGCYKVAEAAGSKQCIQQAALINFEVYKSLVSQSGLNHHNSQFQHSYRYYLRFLLVAFSLITAEDEGIISHPSNSSRHSRKARTQRGDRRQEPYKSPKQPDKPAGRDNNDEEDENDYVGAQQGQDAETAGNERFLACPFFKFNPIEHQDCLSRHRLRDTSTVVQHLVRSHKVQPIHCPTCGQKFDEREDCDLHVQQRSCTRREFLYDGMKEDQFRRLKKNRRRLSEANRWYSIWYALFPDADRPDSPYINSPVQEWADVMYRAWRFVRSERPEISSPEFLTHHIGLRGVSQSSDLCRRAEWDFSILFDWPYLRSLLPLSRENLSFLASDHQAPPSDGAMTSTGVRSGEASQQAAATGPQPGRLTMGFEPPLTSDLTGMVDDMALDDPQLGHIYEEEASTWSSYIENLSYPTDWNALTEGDLSIASFPLQNDPHNRIGSFGTDEYPGSESLYPDPSI